MAKQKQIPYDPDEDEETKRQVEVLDPENQNYPLEPFTPISEQDNDQKTTVSDLQVLNNHLAISSAFLPHVKTLMGLCALSATVCKLIETRRKVKKLQYGVNTNAKGGSVYEVID